MKAAITFAWPKMVCEMEAEMGAHYLNQLFAPESVAVIGATTRENSVGHRVFANMIEAGFKGDLRRRTARH